ncbi:MAG: hypothetical protein ABIJ15_08550 [bacterium]
MVRLKMGKLFKDGKKLVCLKCKKDEFKHLQEHDKGKCINSYVECINCKKKYKSIDELAFKK